MFAAYTADEIEEKTKALRESAKYTVSDDASAVEVSMRIRSLASIGFRAYAFLLSSKKYKFF